MPHGLLADSAASGKSTYLNCVSVRRMVPKEVMSYACAFWTVKLSPLLLVHETHGVRMFPRRPPLAMSWLEAPLGPDMRITLSIS